MSAFKKTHKAMQKPHRERSQPSSRQHLGFLEKKSDYKKRAQNFHSKEKRLQLLRKKALEKNPDEFYHKMVHKKLVDGVYWIDNQRPEDTMSNAQKKLMETQDLNYVQMRLQMEKKKLEKLSDIVDFTQKPRNKRTIFVDSEKEAKRFKVSVEEDFLSLSAPPNPEDSTEKEKRRQEIVKRKQRKKELQTVVDKMEMQRYLADSSVKREMIKKESKTSAAVYKWRTVRKK